ncbi:MAG: RiPP maturation radical SAM C-methyltransferase [Anaerolineae bacterium]|nr:RiPP maturation radical SAM C-methyltransferase [Anaerolineae bacterium]
MLDANPFTDDSDALLIVPPFARLSAPALGVHILQTCAGAAGFQVKVLYANLMVGALIGPQTYTDICQTPATVVLGERLFAASAYDLPPLGRQPERMFDYATHFGLLPAEVRSRLTPLFEQVQPYAPPPLPILLQLEAQLQAWVETVAAQVVARNCRIVGCTTMFEQTAASIALLRRVKALSPQTVTIIGGSNCEGEVAQAIAKLSPAVDYVFSGESEITFVNFLRQVKANQRPAERVIYGQPCHHLDALPRPDFSEFFEQCAQYLPALAAKPQRLTLLYETSRGCWWGQKHHCTFCGLNGHGMTFRAKSPDIVLSELKELAAKYPARQIRMSDNIMPFSYFKTLLPRLQTELPNLELFYEQKANLSLAQVLALKQAGIAEIQPGIEALSTSLLKRMDKGVTARQNIALLRYARAANLRLVWNLLWGFPGDQRQEYEETLALLPLLRHLQPPSGFFHLLIDRFSPYFDRPADYGIRQLEPFGGYAQSLPDEVEPGQIAYHFVADYDCESHRQPELMLAIQRELDLWQTAWEATIKLSPSLTMRTPPLLRVTRETDGGYLLHDTRGLPDTTQETWLSHRQAAVALVARPFESSAEIEWALHRKVGVVRDGWYIPLATAGPELLREFESDVGQSGSTGEAIRIELPNSMPFRLLLVN